MNNVNKTLYIPLYGKAFVSKKGIILNDKKAEEIWASEQFPLKGKSKSKWLAYYLGMRSAVFDKWTVNKINEHQNSIVLHLGCGLDSRAHRLSVSYARWYDVDFQSVIDERKKYYKETENYYMISADLKDSAFIQKLPTATHAIIILEGVSMYLSNEELQQLLAKLNQRFEHSFVLVDCYTPFAAKMSKMRNPINDVGVSSVFGLKSPQILKQTTGLNFVKEYEITPKYLIDELHGFERFIFKFLYAGKLAKKLYKLYEYES